MRGELCNKVLDAITAEPKTVIQLCIDTGLKPEQVRAALHNIAPYIQRGTIPTNPVGHRAAWRLKT